MDFLDMSRADVQAWARSFMFSPADKITVGAAIIRINKSGRKNILLLKRADHEAYYPGVFEVPGGKVDESDSSIRGALSREVAEETGLTVSKILNSLEPFTYTTEKPVSQSFPVEMTRKVALQLSYLVEVQGNGDNFVVNPDEHSEGVWTNMEELPGISMTEEMRRIVLEAFGASV
ncbi:hypothetical protein ACHAP5_011510 [Fusarium lateritium]